MSIIRHRDLPENVTYLTRGTVRRVVTGETGAKSCTLWEQELPPEGYIPPHYHEVEEVVTFLSGRVEVTVGEETAELEADTTVFIPENVVHSIWNPGAEPVRLLGFFPVGDPKTRYTKELFGRAWNSNSRILLHKHFSTNRQGWMVWVFERLDLPPQCRILELGCGSGELWLENMARIPEGWDITLTDFSPEMLQYAQRALRHSPRPFHFREMNAKSVAFEDTGFDAVIANHVLFYMSDWAKALSEAHRVLKPGGRFYASATGRAHLQEMDELVRRFDADADFWGLLPADPFYLENGHGEIEKRFPKVELHRYSDALAIADADLLVDFILSTNARSALVGEKLMAFIQFVEQELAEQETINVTKDMGLFEAVKDGGG